MKKEDSAQRDVHCPYLLPLYIYEAEFDQPMKEIAKEPWNYTFSEMGTGQYALSVVCGGVGIYEFIFRLNPQQVDHYHREGMPFIARLADLVRTDQAPFESQKL